jgi:methyl-accepting chemotaxis protein
MKTDCRSSNPNPGYTKLCTPSHGAEQQSSVAEEISRSVSSICDVAEQSAVATEETSAASIYLARLGGELQALVNRFKLA